VARVELPVVLAVDAPDPLLAELRDAAVRVVSVPADAAVAAAHEHAPAVLLVPVPNAGEAGRERLRELRQDPDIATVPLLAAVPRNHDVRGLASIADDVLRLPSEPGEAAVRVRALARLDALRSTLQDQTEQLQTLAYTDGLTGLVNRRYLEGRLTAAVSSSRRHGRPLCVLVCDVDRFKEVNDERGHEAGDDVLRAVAGAIRSVLREEDVAARWGGDEFVVVLPDTRRSAAQRAADRIRTAVADACAAWPEVTLSIGLADWRGETPDALLRRADRALLEGKRQGRDALVLAQPDS
jgi:two-component system, cell cycle response regulator